MFLGALDWPQLKRGNREPGIIFQKEIACGKKQKNTTFVEMRNTCQVTNQSSHGELSFHHNPHLRLCWGLGLSTSRVIRRGGSRLKNAAHPTYCHCCEFCALKQKPGVLLEKHKRCAQFFCSRSRVGMRRKKNKSQLQTVLITASGPQA